VIRAASGRAAALTSQLPSLCSGKRRWFARIAAGERGQRRRRRHYSGPSGPHTRNKSTISAGFQASDRYFLEQVSLRLELCEQDQRAAHMLPLQEKSSGMSLLLSRGVPSASQSCVFSKLRTSAGDARDSAPFARDETVSVSRNGPRMRPFRRLSARYFWCLF
jgi:hypothetical protein